MVVVEVVFAPGSAARRHSVRGSLGLEIPVAKESHSA